MSTTYECALTGEHTSGKHLILQTTEGPELVSAEAVGMIVRDVIRRVEALEKAWMELYAQRLSEPADGPGPTPTPEPEPEPEPEPPAKRAPRQRKAGD